MDAAARLIDVDPSLVVFEDGLGHRVHRPDPAGGPGAEVLSLRASLTTVPSFEFALRERASRLAGFRHPYYARVRSIDRRGGIEPLLEVVSDAGQGIRLSDLLAGAQARRVPIDINAALCIIRQLVPAVAMLHESAREAGHGAIAPERLTVTPQARLVIVEHVLGAALEQLRYPRERYWNELRIPLPPGPATPRFDHRTDILQIGVVALSLILGRSLRSEEFPARLADVVASTWAVSPRGGFEPLPPGLRGWLSRALQIDPGRSFRSAIDARAELDAVLGDGELVASPASLEAFLARYHATETPPATTVQQAIPRPTPIPEPAVPAPHVAAPPQPAAAEPELTDPDPAPSSDLPAGGVVPRSLSLLTQPGTAGPEPIALERAPAPDVPLDDTTSTSAGPRAWQNWRLVGAVAAVVAVIVAGGSIAARRPSGEPAVHPASGTLEITTNPAGAEAYIDGELRGATPLALALDPGTHTVELRGGGEPRTIPITISPGMKVSQYVELPRSTTAARPASGPRAQAVPAPASTAVTDGAPGTPAVVTGFVSVAAPIDLQVFESGALVGSSRTRLSLSPGRHELELVNSDFGVRSHEVVQVVAGETASVNLQLPEGSLSLNALPWADVWLDGEKVGETPIANLSVRVGRHDLVFRHPELGELHQVVAVTAKEPARLSVDLSAR